MRGHRITFNSTDSGNVGAVGEQWSLYVCAYPFGGPLFVYQHRQSSAKERFVRPSGCASTKTCIHCLILFTSTLTPRHTKWVQAFANLSLTAWPLCSRTEEESAGEGRMARMYQRYAESSEWSEWSELSEWSEWLEWSELSEFPKLLRNSRNQRLEGLESTPQAHRLFLRSYRAETGLQGTHKITTGDDRVTETVFRKMRWKIRS